MPDMVAEAIVIVLDTSRSMYRTDYSPNRLEASKQGLLNFIKKRLDNEAMMGGASSSFALVNLKSTATMIFDFLDKATYDDFNEAIMVNKIKCSGTSSLGDGIGLAIKILIEDIRTNGARVPRILIFSDGKPTQSKVDPIRMVKLAQQLGMHIDSIRIGEVEHFNILKHISDMTDGKYFYSNNIQEILSKTNDLAISNFEAPGTSYQKGKIKISNNVLKKIARPLLTELEMKKGTLDQKDLLNRLRGTKEYQKCSICFQSNDPISKTNFSISGRYCPNCATPVHLSCASMWAKSQDKAGDGTVFRCVHCLYLLKIPASIQTAVRMHSEVKKRKPKHKEVQTYNVTPVMAKKLGDLARYSACPVCNGIFEDDDMVVKCGNPSCKAIYHENHFDSLPDHRCKVCKHKLVRLFQ